MLDKLLTFGQNAKNLIESPLLPNEKMADEYFLSEHQFRRSPLDCAEYFPNRERAGMLECKNPPSSLALVDPLFQRRHNT
jgi:hypothetical protein